MTFANSEGVRIYFEETGAGEPLVFLHEYGGDHESWQDQIRMFCRSHRCIAIAARGYPPSDAPEDPSAYGQDYANRDVIAVLDHLGLQRVHLVGLSMGAYTALQLALNFPDRVVAAVAASGGSGSYKPARDRFAAETEAVAAKIEADRAIPAKAMASGPARIQLKHKDPAGWQNFVTKLTEHPPLAAAHILRQIQLKRPSLYDLEERLGTVKTPVLLLVGDEDESCLDVNLFLKRTMASAQLVVLPGCGHLLNLEEPALFHQLVERFLVSVERGRWRPRDLSAMPAGGVNTALGLAPADA